MKILVIEDHPKIRENIITFLNIKGYVAEGAIHGEEAFLKLSESKYDVLILDVNLPVMNGKEFLTKLRAKGEKTPVIALTSNSMLEDKLEMFDLGVDDYLTKPFELLELEARLNSLFKRKEKTIEDMLTYDDLEVNITKHKILQNGVDVPVSNKEFLIVEFLLKNKGYPKSKSQILEYAWGEREEGLDIGSVTMEAHISYLRKKFGKKFIKTIKGVGYVME